MMPGAIMIFAAGRGTRMGDLTATRPKPLIPVAGRPLIDHALRLTDGKGLCLVVTLHYLGGQIRRHLVNRDIHFSDESARLLETGGGLRHALPLLGGDPVFTLNSDAVWHGPNPLDALARAWDPARMDALLMLVPPERAAGHPGAGDFTIGADGLLERGPGLIYSGAQIVRTDRLAEIEEAAFSLNRLWDLLAADDRLYGLPYDGRWCDVGHPDGLALAERMLEGADV